MRQRLRSKKSKPLAVDLPSKDQGRYWQFVFQIVDENDLGVSEPQWALSDELIPAQELWQWTLGASYETKTLLIDADIYLKNNHNLTSLNLRVDRGFERPWSFDGKSTASGFDFLLRKRWRNYSLWLSYATGQVEQQFPELNDSLPYPARHDIRQRLNFVNTYSLPHWDFSFNVNLRSGTPYSRAEVVLCEDCDPQNKYALSYPRLNAERLPGAARLDLGATYKFERRKMKGKIGMSIYNLLNRRNLLDKDFLLENTPEDTENPWKLQELNRLAAGVTPNLFFLFLW